MQAVRFYYERAICHELQDGKRFIRRNTGSCRKTLGSTDAEKSGKLPNRYGKNSPRIGYGLCLFEKSGG